MENKTAEQSVVGGQSQALLRLLAEMQALCLIMPGRVAQSITAPVRPTSEADFDNMPV